MRTVVAIAVVLVAVSLSACGGAARRRSDKARAVAAHPTTPRATKQSALTPAEIACTAPARAAMAAYLHISTATISESASVGNNAMPQCVFRTQLSPRTRVDVLVNVDNGASPYFRLMRTDVEDTQGFPTPNHAVPSTVPHLGLEADWFPQFELGQLMTTDGYRLITVGITWAHEPVRERRALTIAIARRFLHTPHGKAAAAIANDYP